MTINAPATTIVCTGYSMACVLGMDAAAVLASLRSGGRPLPPSRRAADLGVPAGGLPAALQEAVDPAGFDSRQARLAMHLARPLSQSVERALKRWGAARVGLIIGTSTGGLSETEDALGETTHAAQALGTEHLQQTHAMAAALEPLARRFGVHGPQYVVSTACTSGAKTIASARRLIQADVLDAAIVGGFDTLCDLTLRGFAGLGILSRNGCRPFSAERDGTALGEGGALLLLERDGEGPARLLGVGESSDAYQMSAPDPEGRGAEAAMRGALAQAGVTPETVAAINAHGTATRLNDAAEVTAINRVFGEGVTVVATKGYTGHLLGAAGALESALCVAALEQGWLPASYGSAPPDPTFPVTLTNATLSLREGHLLSNSFAFGGNNVSVLWGAP